MISTTTWMARQRGSIGKALLIVAGVGCGGIVVLIASCVALSSYSLSQARAKQRSDQAAMAEKEKAFEHLSPEVHLDLARKAIDANDQEAYTRNMKLVPKDTPGREKVEALRAKQKLVIQRATVNWRKDFAKRQEDAYLDKGMNATVTAIGPDATVLHIKWALVNKVAAHELGKGDLLDAAKKEGFKRVELTNGFSSSLGETYYWDLDQD